MMIKSHVIVLSVLLFLFGCRVLGQLVQLAYPLSFLPDFDAWQSGALPYPALLFFQIVIIGAGIKIIIKIMKDQMTSSITRGRVIFGVGAVYFLVMTARLAIGVFYPDAPAWFLVKIPAIFHLVLASFLLTLGHYHLKLSRDKS